MGIEQNKCWIVLLNLKVGLKLSLCAKRSPFCEESNGDSEDARRLFKNLSKPSQTVRKPANLCKPSKHIYT
eukprot:14221191-Heterocapsa_arctica.AAC.1